MANNLTQPPVTHTVDMTNAVDPVDSGSNTLAKDVRTLFPESTTSSNVAVIRRAPIYDQATGTLTQEPELGTATLEDPRLSQPRIGNLDDQPQQASLEQIDLSEVDLIGDTLEPVAQPTPEVQEPGFEQFAQQFEKYMGIPLTQAQQTVQQLQEFQAQVAYDRQMSTLSQEWGVPPSEAEARLEQVRDRYSKLSSISQQALAQNPIQAAQLIWQKLQAEQAQKQVPTLDRSGTRRPTALPRGAITKAEIQAMSNDEYASRQDEIMKAYANGLVI